MIFLALIIALALLQYWGSASPIHRDQWFRDCHRLVNGFGLAAAWQLLLLVLLPFLLLLWLMSLFEGWLFGLVELVLLVLVLLYSFGRRDFEALVGRYREVLQQGDMQAAFIFSSQQLAEETGEECPSGAEQMHRWSKQRFCYLGFERWFAVIFYFALLGAPGALAYRLLHLCLNSSADASQQALVVRLLYYLDWIPSRLLIFAFALTGDWVGSREQVMASLRDTSTGTAEVLSDGAHAALGLKATVFSDDNGDSGAFAEISAWEIGEMQGLLSRSAVAWVVVLSVLVLVV